MCVSSSVVLLFCRACVPACVSCVGVCARKNEHTFLLTGSCNATTTTNNSIHVFSIHNPRHALTQTRTHAHTRTYGTCVSSICACVRACVRASATATRVDETMTRRSPVATFGGGYHRKPYCCALHFNRSLASTVSSWFGPLRSCLCFFPSTYPHTHTHILSGIGTCASQHIVPVVSSIVFRWFLNTLRGAFAFSIVLN